MMLQFKNSTRRIIIIMNVKILIKRSLIDLNKNITEKLLSIDGISAVLGCVTHSRYQIFLSIQPNPRHIQCEKRIKYEL